MEELGGEFHRDYFVFKFAACEKTHLWHEPNELSERRYNTQECNKLRIVSGLRRIDFVDVVAHKLYI